MKMRQMYLLVSALLIGVCSVQIANAAALLLPSPNLSQAPASNDPIVGTYDSTRYGTTFDFQPDGTIVGADGLGDGSWQATDPAHHVYTVKIRPSKMGSPERSESWTLVLEKAGLTQNNGQSIIFGRLK
jgi:hypothetical protein